MRRGDLRPTGVRVEEHGRVVRVCLEVENTTRGFIVVDRVPVSRRSGREKMRETARRYAAEYGVPVDDRLGG